MRLEQCDKFEVCQLQRGHEGNCQWSSAGMEVHRFAPAPPPASAVSSAPGFPDSLPWSERLNQFQVHPGAATAADIMRMATELANPSKTSSSSQPDADHLFDSSKMIPPDAGAQAQGGAAGPGSPSDEIFAVFILSKEWARYEKTSTLRENAEWAAHAARKGLEPGERVEIIRYVRAKPPAPVPVEGAKKKALDALEDVVDNPFNDKAYAIVKAHILSTPEAAQPPREMRLRAEVEQIEGMPSSQLCIFRVQEGGNYLIHSEMGRNLKDAHDEIAFRINAFEAQPPREETR